MMAFAVYSSELVWNASNIALENSTLDDDVYDKIEAIMSMCKCADTIMVDDEVWSVIGDFYGA